MDKERRPIPNTFGSIVLTDGRHKFVLTRDYTTGSEHPETAMALWATGRLRGELEKTQDIIRGEGFCDGELVLHTNQAIPERLQTFTLGTFTMYGTTWYVEKMLDKEALYRNPLNYRHVGITDSETEGWSRPRPSADSIAETPTSAIILETGMAAITCEILADQDRPGFRISMDIDGIRDSIIICQDGHQLVIFTDEENATDSTLRFRFARPLPLKK